ncbi:hypothetical protein HDU98_006885 [Podochytrium sp. JEL0797]|nr:hypothetical protein HDU98_006885 [Podochytrium sp. JEL0797]
MVHPTIELEAIPSTPTQETFSTLQQLRHECGWDEDCVPSWFEGAANGNRAMFLLRLSSAPFEIIGMVSLIFNEPTEPEYASPLHSRAELASLFIRTQYQRHGFGDQAIQLIHKVAREEFNIKELTLQCSEEDAPLIRLYKLFGYARFGERFWGVDKWGPTYAEYVIGMKLRLDVPEDTERQSRKSSPRSTGSKMLTDDAQPTIHEFFKAKTDAPTSKASSSSSGEANGPTGENLFMKGIYCTPLPKKEKETCPPKCKNNPNCINCFSTAKWTSTNAQQAFLRIANRNNPSDQDITSLSRIPRMPLGLKNLSATCYLNTLLQVWFHNIPFRKAVFAYRLGAGSGANAKHADRIIKNLQLCFAYLMHGAKNVCDPKPFVDALGIDGGIQQDAQEFSKLFTSTMETLLSPQPTPTVSTLIPTLFEGTCSYLTQCATCHYSTSRQENFRDVELSITPDATLASSFESYLATEHLDAQNKWFCVECGSKQPATRQIRFHRFPRVLNVQILRFRYDVEKQTKRKVKTAIEFPECLNVAGMLVDRPQGEREGYLLTAVLMHRGASAYAGHFIARIRVPEEDGSSCWFTFNDEVVTKLEKVGFDVSDVDVYEEASGVGDKRRKKESEIAAAGGGGAKKKEAKKEKEGDSKMFSSAVAYMLIYTKQSEWDANLRAVKDCEPTESLLDEIRVLNRRFDEDLKAHKEQQEALTTRFETMRALRLSVVSDGAVFSDSEPSHYVESDAFRAWLKEGVFPPDLDLDEDGFEKPRLDLPESGDTKPEGVEAVVERLVPQNKVFDNKALLCEHGKLNYKTMQKSKRLSKKAVELLVSNGYSFDPPLTQEDFCPTCEAAILGEQKHVSNHMDHVEMFKDALADPEPSSDEFWISTAWLTGSLLSFLKYSWLEWRKKNPFRNESGEVPLPTSGKYLDHVLCPHDGLKLDEQARERVPLKAFGVLKMIFDNDLARLPKCGETDACEVCKYEHEVRINDTAGAREKADVEKVKLKKLASANSNVTTLPSKVGQTGYFVSAVFIEQWRQFLRDPIHVNPPATIDNSIFQCPHSELCFDPSDSCEDKPGFAYSVVSEADWDDLFEWYNANFIFSVEREAGQAAGGFLRFEPVVCKECKNERFKEQKDLLIKVINITDPPPSASASKEGTLLVDLTEDSPPSAKNRITPTSFYSKSTPAKKRKLSEQPSPFVKFQALPDVVTPSRQSRRLMEKKNIEFRLGKGKTVLDLKTKISEKWSVPPIHQQLYFRNAELTVNNQTIESLGMDRFDVFQVKLLTEKSGLFDEDEESSSGARAKEMGFAGTGLLGFGGGGGGGEDVDLDAIMRDAVGEEEVVDGDLEVAMRMSLEMLEKERRGEEVARGMALELEGGEQGVDVGDMWACSSCTFANEPAHDRCAICAASRS